MKPAADRMKILFETYAALGDKSIEWAKRIRCIENSTKSPVVKGVFSFEGVRSNNEESDDGSAGSASSGGFAQGGRE